MADDASPNPFDKFNADSPYYQGAEAGAPPADAGPRVAPSAPPPQPVSSGNPFDKFNADSPAYQGAQPQEPQTTASGALAAHAALGVAPTAASIVGAAAGGALLGSGEGIMGGPVGMIVGGIGGALVAGYAASKVQDYAIDALPDSYKDPLTKTLAAQEKQHPTASFVGGLVPFALTMSPAAGGRALAANATNLERLMASPVTERLFSGAIAGGQQLGS